MYLSLKHINVVRRLLTVLATNQPEDLARSERAEWDELMEAAVSNIALIKYEQEKAAKRILPVDDDVGLRPGRHEIPF